jgi:hypothetical protein
MSDSVKLTPALPVVPPLPPQPALRPDLRVEPADKTRADTRTADNGNGRNAEEQAQPQSARSLTISRQDKLGGFIYRSIDAQSGEVVWQYPADSILRMSQALREMQKAMEQAEGQNANQKA